MHHYTYISPQGALKSDFMLTFKKQKTKKTHRERQTLLAPSLFDVRLAAGKLHLHFIVFDPMYSLKMKLKPSNSENRSI